MTLLKSTKDIGWARLDNEAEMIVLLEHLEDVSLAGYKLHKYGFPTYFQWQVRPTRGSYATLRNLISHPNEIPCRENCCYAFGDLLGYKQYKIPKILATKCQPPRSPKNSLKSIQDFKKMLGRL